MPPADVLNIAQGLSDHARMGVAHSNSLSWQDVCTHRQLTPSPAQSDPFQIVMASAKNQTRNYWRSLFARSDRKPVPVGSGRSLLHFLHQGHPDKWVAVLDGYLSDIDVLQAVRSLNKNSNTECVLVCSRRDENLVLQALHAGVRCFVVQPKRHEADSTLLSDREVEILSLVASGCSNSEVAQRLHLSPLTVKSHLARIGMKLGTGDRAGMVAQAMRRQLLN